MIQPKHKQNGLSLIELMIAIGLSMILTLGVIQIFMSSKQTSRVQDSLARLQENARFALDLLAHDIRMAGQLGCNSNALVINNSGVLREMGNGIFGYEYSNALNVVLLDDNGGNPDASDVVAATDSLVVMHAAATSIAASSTNDTITAVNHGFVQGEPLIISDCDNADLFVAGAVANDTITIGNGTFSKNHDIAKAQLSSLNYNAYYIRTNNGQRNLYRSYANNNGNNVGITTEPLLEGVEDFQILYGEDINSDGNSIRYVDADTIGADMSKVVSVRIHLLLATLEDNLASTNQQYWYLNCDADAPNTVALCDAADDRRLYRNFTTTVQLRNQGIGI